MDDLIEQWDSLEFSIERSIRYHRRRQGFLEKVDRLITFILILLGSATVGLSFQREPKILLCVGITVAALSSISLVWNFGRDACIHHQLQKRFSDLLISMKKVVHDKQSELKKLENERLAIETEEPAVFRALDVSCHNELVQAKGWNNFRKLTFIQKAFMQLHHFEGLMAPLKEK